MCFFLWLSVCINVWEAKYLHTPSKSLITVSSWHCGALSLCHTVLCPTVWRHGWRGQAVQICPSACPYGPSNAYLRGDIWWPSVESWFQTNLLTFSSQVCYASFGPILLVLLIRKWVANTHFIWPRDTLSSAECFWSAKSVHVDADSLK